jgi:hypothetical protein
MAALRAPTGLPPWLTTRPRQGELDNGVREARRRTRPEAPGEGAGEEVRAAAGMGGLGNG